MNAKGEPLTREQRFRLRGDTGLMLIGFLAFHLAAYFVVGDVYAGRAFRIPNMSTDTVRAGIYGTMGLLYFAAWLEVIRMLYVRW